MMMDSGRGSRVVARWRRRFIRSGLAGIEKGTARRHPD
jgi:hypothetical protein